MNLEAEKGRLMQQNIKSATLRLMMKAAVALRTRGQRTKAIMVKALPVRPTIMMRMTQKAEKYSRPRLSNMLGRVVTESMEGQSSWSKAISECSDPLY